MRARHLALVAVLLAASCSGGTYVTVTLQASGLTLSGVTRIDLDLQLPGKSASAKLKGNITFPTTTVLDIASGEGTLQITANAIDGSGHIVAQTSGTATVTRGKTTAATLDFGTSGGGAGDMASGDAGPCGVCDPVATCALDSAGVASCTCPSGYSGDGHTCADIDECALGLGGCDANATCSNTNGSHVCSCNPGYAGTGFSCQPIWIHVADDANVDLLNLGNVIGFGNRIYFGNENSGNLQYWHYVDLSMSTATASTLMPPLPPSQNDFCGCGACGGHMKMVQLQSASNRFYYWCYNLEYFDAAGNAWTQAPSGLPMANQRDHAAVGSVGAKIYQVAGRVSGTMVATTQILDFTANATSPTITAGVSYPLAVETSVSAVIGSKIYVFGGDVQVGSQTQSTRKSYMFDTSSGATMWTAIADIPFDVGYYIQYSAVYNNLIWMFDRNSQLHSYDPVADKWDATPPIQAPAGYGNSGRGWMPVTSGTTPALYIVNYANAGGVAKVSLFKYGF